MENFYTAYEKTINGVPFYFVKKYQTFPEYNNVLPILEQYGMHTNFERACKIAMIDDEKIQQELLDKMENISAKTKVIQINSRKAHIYNFRKQQLHFPSILKMIGLR